MMSENSLRTLLQYHQDEWQMHHSVERFSEFVEKPLRAQHV